MYTISDFKFEECQTCSEGSKYELLQPSFSLHIKTARPRIVMFEMSVASNTHDLWDSSKSKIFEDWNCAAHNKI